MELNNSTTDISESNVPHIRLNSDSVLTYLVLIFKLILNPVLGVVGVCANAINVVVFFKMGLSSGVTQNFFILSISDALLAVSGVVNSSAYASELILRACRGHRGSAVKAQLVYRLSFYAPPFFQSISTTTTVVIAVVRCCCVTMPLQIKAVITARRQLAAILLFSLLSWSGLLYAFSPLRVTYREDAQTNRTSANVEGSRRLVFVVVTNAIFFVSFLTLVGCVVILSISLKRSSKFRSVAACRQASSTFSDQRETRTIKTVVMVCIIYTVCNSIYAVYTVLGVGFGPQGMYDNYKSFGIILGETAALTNVAVNIFVYFFYNTRYRNKLRAMIR